MLLWQQAAAPYGAAGLFPGWVPLGWSPVRWGLLQQHALSVCNEAVGPPVGSAVMTCAIMLALYILLQPLHMKRVLCQPYGVCKP